MTIDIFLVDDRYLMREAIKSILKDEPGISIVGTAKDGQEAIVSIKQLQPDIVLLDIEMPKVNGITVTKYIAKLFPEIKIIILSSHNDRNYISQALEAGASSYLLKDSLVEDLKQAIYSLSRGYSYMEAKLLNQALNRIKANNIVNSGHKPIHLQQYRKHIYIPQSNTDQSQPNPIPTSNEAKDRDAAGISKVSLASIFNSTSANEIKTAEELRANLPKIYRSPGSTKANHHQQPPKKLLWMATAIISFIISVIIFK